MDAYDPADEMMTREVVYTGLAENEDSFKKDISKISRKDSTLLQFLLSKIVPDTLSDCNFICSPDYEGGRPLVAVLAQDGKIE